MIRKVLDWLRGGGTPPSAPRIPDELWERTVADLPFLDGLDAGELGRLRSLADDFLGSKEFSTAGDLELDDGICVSIAVQGCLPILNLGLDWYDGWVGVIVYPDEFVVPRQIQDEFGVVHEYDEVAAGEAWGGGPLIVSWQDAQMAGEGYNVVIHEFAHKLDMLNGPADGFPPLHPEMSRQAWLDAFEDAYTDFCDRVDAGEDTEIDPYGAEAPGEFFAVVSEAFFEMPDVVRAEYPALYAQLAAFYRQDPAARLDRVLAERQ